MATDAPIPIATERRSGKRRAFSVKAVYSDEDFEALRAVDRYKREKRRPFPAITEILDILRSLGWRRIK